MKKLLCSLLLCACALSASAAAYGSRGGAASGISGVVNEPMFSFTDIATANRSTLKHGLAQKFSGNAWQVEIGSGIWGDLDDLLEWGSGPFPAHAAGEIPIRSTTNWTVISPTTAGFLQWGDGPSLGTGNEWFIDAVPAATTGNAGLLPTLSGSATDVLRGNGTFGAVPGLSGAVTSAATSTTNSGRIVKFSNTTGTQVASSTMISESGGTVTIDGNLSVTGTLGSAATDLTVDTITVGGGTTPLAGILTAVVNVSPSALNVNDTGGAANCTGTNPKIVTMTVTGAAVGIPGSKLQDAVIVSYPVLDMGTDFKWMEAKAWVSAADTVTVFLYWNAIAGGTYDPPAFDLAVTVLHYP